MNTLRSFLGTAEYESRARYNSSLDIVMYTAFLASDPRAIDLTMDSVRIITARMDSAKRNLSQQDVKQLERVYFDLENYLTNNEPLRAYTKDTIREKIAKKFQIGTDGIEAYWRSASTEASKSLSAKSTSTEVVARTARIHRHGRKIIGGSLLVGAAGLLIPAIPSPEFPFSNNVDMAFSLGAAAMLFGAVWLFLKGLAGFKSRLRNVYKLLCAAMILLALAQAQQIIYTYFGLWTVPFIRQGGVALGFVPATVLLYVSLYRFARILQIRTFSTSIVALLATGGLVAGVSALLPISSPLPPEILRQVLPPSLFLGTLIAFAALIALDIKKITAKAYGPALAWLFLGLVSATLVALLYALILIFLPPGNVLLSYGLISFLFIGTGILMVRSAVAFNLINED